MEESIELRERAYIVFLLTYKVLGNALRALNYEDTEDLYDKLVNIAIGFRHSPFYLDEDEEMLPLLEKYVKENIAIANGKIYSADF